MRFIFLFSSKLWVYLTELPVLILLAIAYHYNDSSNELLKLYPLQIFLVAAAIFILLYFFRAITITEEEIRYHGLFSSRDSAVINKDKTLIITMKSHNRLAVELFGNDGRLPMLDWISDSDAAPMDIFLFRGKAVGGRRSVRRVLRFFGVADEDIASALTNESFSGDYDNVSLEANKCEDVRVFRIKMKETL